MSAKRRWPRRLARGALVLLALALVGAGLATLALRSPRAQRALIERLSQKTETAMGFAVEAEGFRLRPLGGRLELDGPRLRVPGAAPFAAARRLRVRWRLAGLLSRPRALDAIDVEDLEIDLRAPLPAAAGAAGDATAPPTVELPVSVGRLTVAGGRVLGGAAGGTVDGWSVSDLDLEAGFDGRRLDLRRLAAAAGLTPGWRGGEPLAFDVELSGRAGLDGALEIEALRLAGEALSARLSGAAAAGLDAPRASFEIAADPGLWLSGEASGALEARGELDLGSWRGRVTVGGDEQPGALLAPLLPQPLAGRLELADSALGLAADLQLAPERSITGELRLAVSRPGTTVLAVEIRPRLATGADLAAEAAVTAELLPEAPGARRLAANLLAAAARDPQSWYIEAATLDLEEPDLDRRLDRLAGLYPRLLEPASLDGLPALGSLRAEGRAEGPLSDPRISAAARWEPPRAGRVLVTAEGSPRSGPLRVTSSGSGVEIGHFTTAAAGRVDWSATVEDALGAARGRLELAAGPLANETGPLVESLTARLDGDRRRVAWRIEAERGGGARLTGDGTVDPVLPLARAAGSARLETGDSRLPALDASFELAGGALATSVEAAVADRGPVTVEALVPLAALEELAGLADLPLLRRGGAVEVSWNAEPGSWLAVLPPELAARVGRLRAGSAGRLAIRPDRPLLSTSTIAVTGLELEIDGRPLTAAGDVELTLADGRLRLAPWALTGPGLEVETAAELALDESWRPADAVARLASHLDATVAAEIDSIWLESLPLAVVERGVVDLAARVRGPLDRLDGAVTLAAPGLEVALDAAPDLRLGSAAARLSITDGTLTWDDASLTLGEARISSRGSTRLAEPLAAATGRVDLATGLPVLVRAGLPFALRDGWLTIDGAELETAGGTGSLSARVPVGDEAGRAARLAWELPANDWAPLLRHLTGGEDFEALEAALRGRAEVPLERPAELVAEVAVERARAVLRGRESRIEPSLTLIAGGGEVRIAPFELRSGEETFSFAAQAELDPGFAPGDPPSGLIRGFSLRGDGAIDAALLNPFLAGGRGDGPLRLDLELAGSPADWNGRVRIDGPEASILFRGTYLARFQQPRLDLTVADGAVTLERGSVLLNEGEATMSGRVWGGGETDLSLRLSDALFRLDYGLLATLGADLRLRIAEEGPARLSGTVDVQRGSLTRTLRPDFDFLTGLLSPVDLATTEESALDLLTLDLEIGTREGVRVDNNLAQMLVRWEPLAVTGTASRPVIEGRLEADPGGLLFLYGQTVRLDSAAIEYPGIENAEARLDFEATTSLEDPTIGRLAGTDPFRSTRRGEEPPAADATGDLARYVGESLAGRVGEAVGVAVSLRPLLIFGETDPAARLTVSRDLSPFVSLAASIDLRQAEAQTYLLEAHELAALPRLVAQVFSDDQSRYGGVLLQRQELGGSRPVGDRNLPRVAAIAVDPPPGVSRRGIRRAAGLQRGDPYDEDRRFAAEVEVVDYLRRKGYADAEVSIRQSATRRGGRVRLEVAIDPGPRARFVFEGEKLPAALRRLIADLYRADFFEPDSLVEMKTETVRALRSRGFLDPEVEVVVEPEDPAAPDGDRRVVVRTDGGVRVSPRPPVFLGLPPEDVAVLDALFYNSVQRVELAVGLPSADRRLLAALADLGYPEARIAARYEALGERALTVEIEPGPRRRIAAVDLVAGDEAAELPPDLEPLVKVAAGDPLRRRELARTAVDIERALGARGHRQARVRTVVEPAAGDDPYAAEVRFAVDPGPLSRVGEVAFRGLRSTRERWARGVTGLEPGELLGREDLARARTSLWRTGLFSTVATDTIEVGPEATRIVFDLAERSRYRLAYGVRWESETGLGAVFDATDDNFRGRGWTLGMRAQYSNEEKSLRFLNRVPRAFGGPGSIELFAAAREITSSVFDLVFGRSEVVEEILETTLQYSHPLDDRTTLRVYGRYTESESQTLFVTQKITDPVLGLQFLFDSRSPEPLARRGIFASVDLSGSEDFLGGDLRYARLFAQFHLHVPLPKLAGGRLTWSQSYRLGLAEAFGQDLIRRVRFFAGGEYSVRGYATESLGERGFLGPLGGAALAVINQELRWRLVEDYSLLFFADAGEVWPEIGEMDFDLRLSAGIGLRAVTPIGLVRLDLAHALDQRPGIDPDFRLYLGLGTVF